MAGMSYEQLMSMQDSGERDAGGSVERGMTFAELQAQARPGPSNLQKGFGNAAMLADMALNLPSDVIGYLGNMGARTAGAIAGGDRRRNVEIARLAGEKTQELAAKVGLIRDPAKKLLSKFQREDAYDTGYVGQAMGLVGEGVNKLGKTIEQGSGGALLTEDVEDIVGLGMTLGGPSAIYHGGKAMLKKAGERGRGAEPPAQQPMSETPPEAPGPIDFERKLTLGETGTRTKAGKVKREGQPYESVRDIPAEERIAALKSLDSEARGIVAQLRDMKPGENGMPTTEQLALSDRLKSITETQRTLQEVEPASPLAREVVYGQEFGRFPEGDQTGFAEPNVQPVLDFGAFKAERTANPLIKRIQAERQAQVDVGFRAKDAEVDQAWKEYKAGQLRENELDGRRQELADLEDQLMQKVDRQKGEISTDQLVTLAALSGATVAGLYAYTHPEQQADIATAAAAVGGVLATKGKLPAEVLARMPARALGPVLAEGKYTLKTLDRLPPNRTEFSPAQVRQELNKPGTAAGEKLTLEPVLEKAEAEGRKITADELVSEFRKQTGDHTLTPKESVTYAEHGLDNIRSAKNDPWEVDDGTPATRYASEAEAYGRPPPKTIVWQFPEHMEVSTSNHFGDPRYYGHTREFREASVDHVMEIQSDLAQSLRKPMTPEQVAGVEAELAKLESAPKVARQDLTAAEKDQWKKLRMSLVYDKTTKATLGKKPNAERAEAQTRFAKAEEAVLQREAELDSRRAVLEKQQEQLTKQIEEVSVANNDRITPKFLELLDKRSTLHSQHTDLLKDPQLVQLRKDRNKAKHAVNTAPKADPGYAPLIPALKNAENRLIREKLGEAAAKGDESVRFATADTVAKVERWSTEVKAKQRAESQLKGLQQQLTEKQNWLKYLEENFDLNSENALVHPLEQLDRASKDVKYFGDLVDRASKSIEAGEYKQNANPGHQSLYDRYAKETASYLQKLGGKEVVDAEGHTWLEVPTGIKQSKIKLKEIEARQDNLTVEFENLSKEKEQLRQQGGSREAFGAINARMAANDSASREVYKELANARRGTLVSDSSIRPFGGRPDSTGQGPIHMYGQADPRLLAGVAAAGLTVAGYFALPEEQREGVKDYLQAVGALGVVAGVTRKAGKGSLADVVRPAEGTRGSITPDRAIKLGALASGAAVGGYIAGDERIAGAIIGGIGGLAATRLPALGRSIGKVISPQQALGSAVRISAALGAGYYLGGKVDHPVEGAALAASLLLGRKFLKPAIARESDAAINTRNGNLKAWDRLLANTKSDIDKLVPDQARRDAISEAIQVGARNHLLPNERTVYDTVTQINAEIGKDAVDAKILKSLRQNYITSIVEFAPGVEKTERQALIDRVFGRLDSDGGAGPGTRFAKARKYDTFSELNKATEGTGLRLKTKDVGEILELYGRSMRKAIEDRILIDFHKAAKAVDGLPYIAKRDSYKRFPPGFRKIDHPQLDNVAVHPEAYDGLKVMLENYHPDIVTAGAYSLSQAIKRSNVFGSLFHAKSLTEVYTLAMGGSMLPRPGDLTRPKRLIDVALDKFRKGGLGDEIDGLIREGLQLEVPDDVTTTILGDLGRLADSKFNTKLGTAVTDKIDYVNKKTDKLTWDYMHTGGKSAIALKAVETFTVNNAELHAKDPARYPLKSKQEIYREASRFANDATGGLDWFRIATEAKTELGRSVAMHFASPQGRRMAQIIAFAPDWAISTLRAGFNSFGKSETGFRGLLKPTNAVDLYRQYALRSAALWITVLNGLQYAMTGTPIWENEDPTRIEFGDGTSVQPGKHSAEAVHAVMNPVKFAMNKLGFIFSLGADVAAARYGAGPLAQSGDSITWHAVKKTLPFTASPMVQSYLTPGQRVGRSVSGGIGFPVHGFTPQQKMMARRERMQEAARKQGDR